MRSVGRRVPFFVRTVVRIFVGTFVVLAAPRWASADAALTLAPAGDGGVEIRAGATVVARVPVTTPSLRRG
ncbi:MAG: hypothetical protein JWM82_38, partial [Myxococcales bacterium]|nr:hypothetical protein [Myxococcales bacterium]